MTMVPWPCDRCGMSGVKNVGSRGYCAVHLTELYGTFDPAVFVLNGVGLQSGALRPDWGPSFADLSCCSCGAGWTGVVGESCWWCQRSHQVMVEHSATLVLRAPEIDPTDRTYVKRMNAWAERLARAVQAGVVERRAAERAWRRACGADAA